MSTYWYLRCLDHEPPLLSRDEVEQHTHGLDSIIDLVQQRDVLPKLPDYIPDDYFARNAVQFLRSHVTCRIDLISEYGEERSI